MEKTKLRYTEIRVGDELPEVQVGPITTEQLVRWTAAADDYNPIHYDQRFAVLQNLPDVIMQGPYKLSIMIRVFEQWIGKVGCLRKINCRYTAMDVPGDVLTFKGTITGKHEEDGLQFVECEWSVINQKGKSTVSGHAALHCS